MTFDQWYKEIFEADWNLAILAKSPPAMERYKQANAAWEEAYWWGHIDGCSLIRSKETHYE